MKINTMPNFFDRGGFTMYQSNRNRVADMLTAMQGQNLPEIALAVPGVDTRQYIPTQRNLDNAATELVSICELMERLNRDTAEVLRGL